MSDARNNILNRLKNIETKAVDISFNDNASIYAAIEEKDLVVQFAEAFTRNGGKFIFCENSKELIDTLKLLSQEKKWTSFGCANKSLAQILDRHHFSTSSSQFDELKVGITTCEALLARTGSVFLSSASPAGRTLSILPDIHIVFATTNQVVADIKDILSLQQLRGAEMPSMLSITSNNSQTADIEKTLVNGAHGPVELYVLMTEVIE